MAVFGLIGGGVSPLVLAPAAQAAPPLPACELMLQDPAAAAALAKTCGKRVEAGSLRTETAQTFMNPDGTQTREAAAYQQRIKKSDGSWASIDLTLRKNADGSVSPVAAPLPLTMSGGGTAPVVKAGGAGKELALTWQEGTLPAPVLDGPVATYPEVLPGVDLKIQAGMGGYSQVLVVKTPQAAKNPKLKKITFGVKTTGFTLTEKPGELLSGVDAQGKEVFGFAAAQMWESGGKKAKTAKRPGVMAAPAEEPVAARQADMPVEVGNGTMSVVPDQSILADPEAAFPIVIDPKAIGPGFTNWCLVGGLNGSWKETEYWWGDGENLAKVGYSYDALYRSMFQWDNLGIQGATVTDAKFMADVNNAWTGGYHGVHLWHVGAISPATNWNNSSWISYLGSQGGNTGSHMEWPITGFMQGLASCCDAIALGLKAPSESDVNDWKRFKPDTVKLSITFNRAPNVPWGLSVDNKPCAADGNRPWVTTGTPTFRVSASDPEGDTLKAVFGWGKWNGSGFAYQNGAWTGTFPSGAQGSAGGFDFVNEGVYNYWAEARDTADAARGSVDRCEFAVDLVDPAAPTVTGDVYKPAGCPPDGCGGVGQAGSFTFRSSADVTSFKWSFDDVPGELEAKPASMGQPVTVTWQPRDHKPKTLRVKAIDRAGRTATAVYQFPVSALASPVARWDLNEGGGTTLANTGTGTRVQDASGNWINQPHVYNATLTGGTLGVPGRIRGGETALRLDGTAGSYAQAPSILDTTRSFSVSAWVKPAALTGHRTIVSQCGAHRCAFYLQYDPGSNRWSFVRPDSGDQAPPAAYYSALSAAPPKLNVWTHLTGVYDGQAGQVRLYVNGVLEGTAAVPQTWAATGPLYLGRDGGSLQGELSEVQVWNRAISTAEVADLAPPVRVGDWAFGEDAPPSTDTSGYYHDLEWRGNATVPTNPAGTECNYDGRCLHLTGAGDGTTNEPVLHTDQSLTVSAWAKLASKGGDQVVITQENPTQFKPFYLMYNAGIDRWTMQVPQMKTGTGTWWSARSIASPEVGKWVRLTGTYNAQTGEVKLFVNNVLQQTIGGAAAWAGTGNLLIGSRGGAGYFAGQIDEVQVYQGVRDPIGRRADVLALHNNADGSSSILKWTDNGAKHDLNTAWTSTIYGSGSRAVSGAFTARGMTVRDVVVLRETGGVVKASVLKNTATGFDALPETTVLNGAAIARVSPVATDLNGDGFDDLVLSYKYDGCAMKMFVYLAKADGSGLGPEQIWHNAPAGTWCSDAARLLGGDFDGDGRGDIMAMYDFGNSSKAFLFKSNGTALAVTEVWNSGAGNWYGTAATYSAGDTDGDGRTEVLAWYGTTDGSSRIWSFSLSGSQLTSTSAWYRPPGTWDGNRTKFTTGDFDGDGRADVLAFYRYDTLNRLFGIHSNGSNFDNQDTTRWESPSTDWNRMTLL
ncbi:LamG-like jellyroll fold domain-containing protein [Longispora albida]|uniref:LamG-like jellyroll fold domain-containing protein n=1 Tax=Longispora albida TaxID=203523 RepID=UPI00036276A9|nr:LamG-like jellyroll fold domain-containing protein [Longispora albida]